MNYQGKTTSTFPSVLRFRIADVSSEAQEGPASNLLTPDPTKNGWQSQHFCSFPQFIIFQFPSPVHVNSLEFLSHQTMIATRIDIYAANPVDGHQSNFILERLNFKKLGYFLLSPNERSNFQARELKTVYLNTSCSFLKLVLHKAHINAFNTYKQVGIISLTVSGEELAYQSNQHIQSQPQSMTKGAPINQTNQYLEELEMEKQRAIKVEDYLLAKEIKQKIEYAKSFADKLNKLEQRKQLAIQNEDYDKAAVIRNEILQLKVKLGLEKPKVPEYQHMSSPQRDYRVNTGPYDGRQGNSNYGLPDKRFQSEFDQNNSFRVPHNDNRLDDFNNIRAQRNKEQNMSYYDEPVQYDQMDEDYPSINRTINESMNRPYIEDDRPLPALAKQKPNESHFYDLQEDEMEEQRKQPVKQPRTRYRRDSNKERSNSPEKEMLEIKKPNYNYVNPHDEKKLDINKNKEELAEFPDEKENEKEDIEMPVVTKKNKMKMDTFLSSFKELFLNKSFATNWNHRQAAITDLLETLENILSGSSSVPTDMILENDPETALAEVWKLNNTFFGDRVPQILNQSFDVFDTCISISLNEKFNLNKIPEFSKALKETLSIILDKVSDFKNTSLLNKTATLLLTLLEKDFIETSALISPFIKLKKVAKKLISFKHLTGRCIVLQKVVRRIKGKSEPFFDEIMEFCCENTKSSNKGVRVESSKLVAEISRFIDKEQIISFMEGKSVRKNQLDLIKEDLDNLGEEDEEEPQESMVKPKKVIKPEAPKKQEIHEQEPIKNQSIHIEEQFTPEEIERNAVCQFCFIKNEDFTNPDNYDFHLWQECPVLTICNDCEQVIEISDLTTHRLNECSSPDLYSKCPRCALAIKKEDFDAHTSKMNCTVFKNEDEYIRCPLCLNDFQITGYNAEDTWREHLVQKGCPNHTRTQNK